MVNKNILLGMSVIVLIFGLVGCVSSPKTKIPEIIIYDPALSEDQMATLFVPPGSFRVTHFEHPDYDDRDLKLKPEWFQPSIKQSGLDVKIPAGVSAIQFNYYNNIYGNARGSITLTFDYVAGRRYKLVAELSGGSAYRFSILETSTMREPGPDEQILFIKQNTYGGLLVVLDKDTENERIMLLDSLALVNEELRVIIPNGEHTIDLALMGSAGNSATIQPDGEQPRQFTASSEPVRYFATLTTVRSGSTSASTTYTLRRE